MGHKQPAGLKAGVEQAAEEAEQISRHTAERGSGRAGLGLEEQARELVRHEVREGLQRT